MFHRNLLNKNILNLTFSFRLSSCIVKNRYYSKQRTDQAPEDSKEAELSKLLGDATDFSDAKDTNWATNPYPETAPVNQQKEPEKLKVLPSDNSVILFPGQGVLKVGMIKQYLHFPKVKELYSIASEILNYDLKKLSLNGPQEKLNRTEFNQTATVVASLAALEKLFEERPNVLKTCRTVSGYSLGELTALIFAGAIDYESGIRLVQSRAKAMEIAIDQIKQGMLFVYTRPEAKIHVICKEAEAWARDLGHENPVCTIAIYLHTQAKIIGGHDEALKYIERNGFKLGLRRMTRIPVSGAFHTPLMQSAVKPFQRALKRTVIETPRVPVISNYDVSSYRNPREIRRNLLKHLTSPVKWEQTLQKLYTRPPGTPFPRTFDVGSDGHLKSILKSVNLKAWDWCYTV